MCVRECACAMRESACASLSDARECGGCVSVFVCVAMLLLDGQ